MSAVITNFPAEALDADSPLKNSTRPLFAGLVVMLLLMSIGMGIGIYQLRHMATTLDHVMQEDRAARNAVNTMQGVTREGELLMTAVLGMGEPFNRDDKLFAFDRLVSEVIGLMPQIAPKKHVVLPLWQSGMRCCGRPM